MFCNPDYLIIGDIMHEREQRLLTSKLVRVFYGGHGRQVDASNISPSGARLAGLRQLPIGALLTLHYGDLRIEAKVAWCDGRFTGVEFLTMLSPEKFLAFQIG
jgi:hypothetical protein